MTTTRIVKPLDSSVAAAYQGNNVINSRYTVWNFIFLNLYEQFRRPINFYFLLVAVLQFIPVIAPVHPLSTLLPLLLAFTLTAVKEGYDDVKRHRLDASYNSRPRSVLDAISGQWQTRKNSDIRVGDVIFLKQDEDIPCDVLVVAASASTVYIRTDNLDGEIDLKPRDVVALHSEDETPGPQWTVHIDEIPAVIAEKLQSLRIECPPPSALIDSFDGRVSLDDPNICDPSTYFSLTHQHFLPQTSRLKNTESIICVALYTGSETKCGMNKRPAPVKWTKIDKRISLYCVFIFCFQISLGIIFGVSGYFMNKNVETKFWYLLEPITESKAVFLIYIMRFFLLTTVMIPISFKFIVDMSKYYMTKTVEWDETMKHNGPDGEGCRVKNSSILEDLGQIDYVLSDKTGTITRNVMELRYVTIGDQQIQLSDFTSETLSDVQNQNSIRHFGRVLALCNTVDVVTYESDGLIHYQSSSPDEEALCYGMAKLGVRLKARRDKEVTLEVDGEDELWKVHYTFAFFSELKSMGVIVENMATSEIYFFVKGADDRVMDMADSCRTVSRSSDDNTDKLIKTTHMHLDAYSVRGLRTLLVAEKPLQQSVLQTFLSKARAAEVSMQSRHEKLLKLRLEMETDVSIIGVTAIEDKLQENVEETLSDFQQAGVKVWMLTGDKVQTAEQIGLSCGLYAPSDKVLRVISKDDWEQKLLEFSLLSTKNKDKKRKSGTGIGPVYESNVLPASGEALGTSEMIRISEPQSQDRPNESYSSNRLYSLSGNTIFSSQNIPTNRCVLVVEGGLVLERILSTPVLKKQFADICDACVSVICARVTPSQKAAVTQFVRSGGFMTLAIGDGGNDVAMLQEAHVGVGISGKEGKQAARAADFSVTRFSDLRALMFVHGQQAYIRTAYVIKYSFYKSILICIVQLIYNLTGTYISGESFWNSFSLTLWNGLYTLPQTLLYCLDRAAPRQVLERHPYLYKMTRRSTDMNAKQFFLAYLLRGMIQSIVTIWLVNRIYGVSFAYAGTGGEASKDVTFSVAYSVLILSQMLTLFLESHSVTHLNAVFIFGMPACYAMITAVFSAFPQFQYYGVWEKTLGTTSFLAAFGVAFLLVIPPFALRVMIGAIFPNPREVLRGKAVRNVIANRRIFLKRIACVNRWLFCIPEEPSHHLPAV